MDVKTIENVDWKLEMKKAEDGTLPIEQVSVAVLMDLRRHLASIHNMLTFFVVLAVLEIIGGILYAFTH